MNKLKLPVMVLLCLMVCACGTYEIRYTMPSKTPSGVRSTTKHGHGIGLGGGLFFFAIHDMFPALIDYTGPIEVQRACPHGFCEISQSHDFGEHTRAAFISWPLVVNWHHSSTIRFRHAEPGGSRQQE